MWQVQPPNAPPCLWHRGGFWCWLCASDRVGLRPLAPRRRPTPSLLQCKSLAEKSLTAKLDVIAEYPGEFPAKPRSIFAGNAMLSPHPGGRGMLARQKLRAKAERNKIMAQGSLFSLPPRGPFLDASDSVTRHGIGRVPAGNHRIKVLRWIVYVGTGRCISRHNHDGTPFRIICRKRCEDRRRLLAR